MRIYHKGTITAEASLGVWGIAIGLASLRGHGYPINSQYGQEPFFIG